MSERVRVYKRKPGESSIFSDRRLWTVGPTPEDTRQTCWPDWDEAIKWATMPSHERQQQIEGYDRMDRDVSARLCKDLAREVGAGDE